MPALPQDAASAAFVRLATIAHLRSDLYHLLAIGFLDPTPALAQGLVDGSYQADMIECFKGLDLWDRTLGRVRAYLEELSAQVTKQEPAELLQALKVEYARLFIGPGPIAVSPYESIHCDPSDAGNRLLMVGPSARAVAKTYKEAGLAMCQDLSEPPDHIATELEFLLYVSRKESTAWEQGDNAEGKKWRRFQKTFGDDHLGKWGIDFCRDVKEATRHSFYATLATVASAFFQFDANLSTAG